MVIEFYESKKMVGSAKVEDLKKDAPDWDGSMEVGDYMHLSDREMQIVQKVIRVDGNTIELHLAQKK